MEGGGGGQPLCPCLQGWVINMGLASVKEEAKQHVGTDCEVT